MYKRCQSAVKIDNEYSNFYYVDRGVKQGYSLSPTLFNYFINDLHAISDSAWDHLYLQNTSINSPSIADDFVIFSESRKGLQTAVLNGNLQ